MAKPYRRPITVKNSGQGRQIRSQTGAPSSAAAASLMMGTAGMPAGLDPANARGANPWSAYGTPAMSPGGGLDMPELVRRSNFWRDNYNPLRGLTIARLMALFEQAERGAFSEIQLTLRKAEKRFPVLKGFKEKLLSTIEGLDGRVRVKEELPDGATPEMAEQQRQYLQGRYDLLKNFRTSIAQIALADLRGYSVLQKHRYQDGLNAGAVRELYWIEPWCWARDGYEGDFYYNENSQFGVGLGSCAATLGEANRIGSENLPREDFVIRECESPLYEIALIAFVNWLMGRKDFAAFTEIFGIPNSVVIMPPNIAVGKEQDYQVVAEKVARGISGGLPYGSDVKFPTSAVRGESPFKEFCELQERDVVFAGTGGQLSMIAQPTGLGKGASEEHDDAWQKIAITKAVRINEALQADFDAVELAAKFPDQPVCVEFALSVKNEEDVGEFLDNLVKADGIGLQADEDEVSKRSGIKFSRKPEPETPPEDTIDDAAAKADLGLDKKDITAAVKNRLVKLFNRAGAEDAEKFYQAIAADLQPLRDRLAAIEKISDPALKKQKFADLYADLDQIAKDITADPESARVLEQINGSAMVKGLENKPATNRRILNMGADQPRDSLGKWVDENGGGLSEKDNIARGNKAVDRAIRQKQDVQKAMYRKGAGQIDFKWGRPGTSKADENGRTHNDGYGISHVIDKHGEEHARSLPNVIAKGKISTHEADENRRVISHEGRLAVLERKNSKAAFVVTSYEPGK